VQGLAPEHRLSLPEAASGKTAFVHNCEQCHQGPLALETRLANKTFLDIGAGCVEPLPLMGPFPAISEPDMRKILAYVWDLQYRGPEGNVTRGELAFAAKGCFVCHSGAGSGKPITPFSMVSIAWGPNRAMHQQMLEKEKNTTGGEATYILLLIRMILLTGSCVVFILTGITCKS
jgi:mono/diheme cytochrome c family protein